MNSEPNSRAASLAPSRHVLALLFLVFGSFFCGLLVVEGALRVTSIPDPNLWAWDPTVGGAHRPGIAGYWWREGGAYFHINSDGWRDREHTKEKPNDTIRIALLGDSYTEALQVPLEDTFGARMEHELQQCPAFNGERVEVLNFGVSGYGTAQELITLRDRVWDYSPDVVVLAFTTGNDVRNNSKVLEPDRLRPFFVLRDDKLVLDNSFRETNEFRIHTSSLSTVYRFFYDHSRALQLLRRVIAARMAAPDANAGQERGLDDAVYHEPTAAAWHQAWQITDKLLITMRDEIRARGVYFMVVTLSNGVQVNPDLAIRETLMKQLRVDDLFYPERHLKELGDREHFHVLTLAPAFQSYADQHKTYLHGFGKSKGVGHWNVDGHYLAGKMIAQALCKALEDRGVRGAPKRQTRTAANIGE